MNVPGLTRKLRLLANHGGYKSIPALAKAINVGRSTVYGWGHGVNERAAGILPDKNRENILKVMRQCFGEDQSDSDLVDLLCGPLDQFEAHLQSRSTSPLLALTNKEGQPASVKLIYRDKMHLIETEAREPKSQPQLTIRFDTWFRLEIKMEQPFSNAIAIQQAGQTWGAVSHHIDNQSRTMHLPGLGEDGEVSHMIERQQGGLHKFIVILTTEKFSWLQPYLDNEIALDALALRRIAAFYERQNRQDRALLVATAAFE